VEIKRFTKLFEYLCLGFDIDPKKKEDRISIYFKSKLGKMDEIEFEELIVKAIEQLNIIKSHIPSIQQLLALRLSMASTNNDTLDELYQMKKEMSPEKILEDLTPSEAAAMARCPMCNNSGFVVMEKGGYTFSGMTCTCESKKKKRTLLGRKSGCYTSYLKKGYVMQETYISEDGAQFYKRKSIAEDMEIQIAYNRYLKKHGEEPQRLEQFY